MFKRSFSPPGPTVPIQFTNETRETEDGNVIHFSAPRGRSSLPASHHAIAKQSSDGIPARQHVLVVR